MPSPVWGEWFGKHQADGGKTIKAKCKKCPAEFVYHSSTTNLFGHVKNAHGVDLKPLPAKGGRKKRSFETTSSFDEDDVEEVAPKVAKSAEGSEVSSANNILAR